MKWPGSYVSAAAMTFDVDGEAGWIAMDPANAHRPGRPPPRSPRQSQARAGTPGRCPDDPAAFHASRYAETCGTNCRASSCRIARKIGMPSSPIETNVSGLVAATRIGGIGDWNGRGVTVTSSNWKYLPEWEKFVSVHARRTISSVSLKRSLLSAYGTL